MAIINMDTLVDGLSSGEQLHFHKQALAAGAAGVVHSMWRASGIPSPGSIPPVGAGEAPTRVTAGAMTFTNPTGGDIAYLATFAAACEEVGSITLYDRLVHTSGLSGTVITAQTVNSVALTRYTDGAGVELWLEQYTAVGTTSRTASISYTNEAGTAGRTATATIGGSTGQFAGRLIPVSLQGSDRGVRSVQSVTLSASTGTAGDFGITLMRRLGEIVVPIANTGQNLDAFDLGLPRVYDDACLATAIFGASNPGPMVGYVTLAKA